MQIASNNTLTVTTHDAGHDLVLFLNAWRGVLCATHLDMPCKMTGICSTIDMEPHQLNPTVFRKGLGQHDWPGYDCAASKHQCQPRLTVAACACSSRSASLDHWGIDRGNMQNMAAVLFARFDRKRCYRNPPNDGTVDRLDGGSRW